MNQEQKPGKRIVSLGTYITNMGNKLVLSSLGLMIFLLGASCAFALCYMIYASVGNFAPSDLFPFAFLALLFGGGGAALLYFGASAIKEARQADAGVPLTPANIDDLPAPDSLVRASVEPLEAQEAVLLCAAVGTQEKHQEQLLRATKGGQEPTC